MNDKQVVCTLQNEENPPDKNIIVLVSSSFLSSSGIKLNVVVSHLNYF